MGSTICSRFCEFYNPVEVKAWPIYSPKLKREKHPKPSQVINIEKSFLANRVSEKVKRRLDHLITRRVYQKLIAPNHFDKRFFVKKGFTIVKGGRSNRVLEHPSVPNYLIKICVRSSRSIPIKGKDHPREKNKIWRLKHTNLLRPAGRTYFKTCLIDARVKKWFEFPEEYLYSPIHASRSPSLQKHYFAVSEKKEIYTGEATKAIIESLPEEGQRKVARIWIKFVKKTGFIDMLIPNIVIRKDLEKWRFCVVDPEPFGAVIEESDKGRHLISHKYRVLLGLIRFRDEYCLKGNMSLAMKEEAENAIQQYLKDNPDIELEESDEAYYTNEKSTSTASKVWKWAMIILSIVIPLIPILVFLWTCVEEALSQSSIPASTTESVYL